MVVPSSSSTDESRSPSLDELVLMRGFRVPASIVYSHLLDFLENGRRTFGTSTDGPPEPIRHVFDIGKRLGPAPDGQLDDTSSSTTEHLSLAKELRELVIIGNNVEDRSSLRLSDWAAEALGIIEKVEKPGVTRQDLDLEQLTFAKEKLAPVLHTIADLPPEPIAE